MDESKRKILRQKATGHTVVPFLYKEMAEKPPAQRDEELAKTPEPASEEPPILGVEYTLEDAFAYRDQIPELFEFIGGEDAQITQHFLQAFDEQILTGHLCSFERLEAFFAMVETTAKHIRNYLEYNAHFVDNRLTEMSFDQFIGGFSESEKAQFSQLFPEYFKEQSHEAPKESQS